MMLKALFSLSSVLYVYLPQGSAPAAPPVGQVYVYMDQSSGSLMAQPSGGVPYQIAPGNVAGPGSATDGAAAVFDGTTGKLLKNSGLVNVLHQRSKISNPVAASNTCTATCGGGGEVVAGGGCQDSGTLPTLFESYPSADNAWSCSFTTSVLGTCTAWAICVQS